MISYETSLMTMLEYALVSLHGLNFGNSCFYVYEKMLIEKNLRE